MQLNRCTSESLTLLGVGDLFDLFTMTGVKSSIAYEFCRHDQHDSSKLHIDLRQKWPFDIENYIHDLNYMLNNLFVFPQAMTDSDLRALYDEELAVAKDAISNLRTSFRYENCV